MRLTELLSQAVERVRAVIAERGVHLASAQLAAIAEAAGIGAVKYADLSTSRTKDYAFDVERMVSLTGNAGVYLQYAHARIRSILAKAPGGAAATVEPSAPLHPAERTLILLLDEFDATLREVARTLEPHRLCGYLFDLAKAFTDFFGSCLVLRAESEVARGNRLALCRLAGDTLARGLGLLGLKAPTPM